MPPKTSYVKSGEVSVAYQVLGDGPPDLVYVWGWLSHLDFMWSDPTITSFIRRLADIPRLIIFDKGAPGPSDTVGPAPTSEWGRGNTRAVMAARRSGEAATLGLSRGASNAARCPR